MWKAQVGARGGEWAWEGTLRLPCCLTSSDQYNSNTFHSIFELWKVLLLRQKSF